MIGSYDFENGSILESGPKYAGARPNVCAYCEKDDHKWIQCYRTAGYKNKTTEDKPSRQPQASSAHNSTRSTLSLIYENPDGSNVDIKPSSTNNRTVNDYSSFSSLSKVVARVLKTITFTKNK